MANDGNENIVHVEAIEGLISQVFDRLDKIRPNNKTQRAKKSSAFEEMDLFQKTTLPELRVLFERD